MGKGFLVSLFERLFFNPTPLDWIFILLLSPLSFLYGVIMLLRRVLTPKIGFKVPILSVGNLTVGGSGKTPFVIALASMYGEGVYIVSRGYGRRSRGLVEVSRRGKILVDVYRSGDEPMLMAKQLPQASIIVSENRIDGINFAIDNGAKTIILDDGFNRVEIKKFEILLFPSNIKNYFPFPAGGFREFYFSKLFADLSLIEDRDFKRVVTVENRTERMLLITAISNPKRLDKFLPNGVIDKIYFEDHSYFDEENLKQHMQKSGATSLLTTEKDEVKMENFNIPLSIMRLRVEIFKKIL